MPPAVGFRDPAHPGRPLVTKHFPTTDLVFRKYDTNKDGALDPAELNALANDIQKRK